MDLAVDLHAHSVFAGGAQALKLTPERFSENKKRALDHLIKTNNTMPLKGVDIIGTGDCQFTIWTEILKEVVVEDSPGIFYLQDYYKTRFILQTEIIFTLPIKKHSKIVHVVFLFPDFTSVDIFRDLLTLWEVKHEKMARPFVKCNSPEEISKRIYQILNINPLIEVIPAHIMTPQGIFGSNIRINKLSEFFGDVSENISILETGLSADPHFLGLIPELDNKTLISNSDAHSSALHRMGREFTVLEVSKINYSNILSALRKKKVNFTVEFPPEEGRFFLTGHRAGRKKPGVHGNADYCYFSPQHVPKHDLCPICHKELTIGVFQRCVEISKIQGGERSLENKYNDQKFIRMVPLIDILSSALNIKTKTSKTLIRKYKDVVSIVGSEIALLRLSEQKMINAFSDKVDEKIREALIQVKRGNFTFFPYGYDGEYGTLKLGERGNFQNINVVKSAKLLQERLI
jgi:PHP family Zn ribbon phosphoesterase